MVVQLVLTGGIVAAAAGYVAWSAWRTWFPPTGKACGGCGSGCGGAKPAGRGPTFVPAGELGVLRR